MTSWTSSLIGTPITDMIYNGLHYMMDLVVHDTSKLNDANALLAFMNTVVETIGMTVLMGPLVIPFPVPMTDLRKVLEMLEQNQMQSSEVYRRVMSIIEERTQQTNGYTGVTIVAESHITIHTFPSMNFLSMDVYSCKGFSIKDVRNITINMFGPVLAYNEHSVNRHIPNPVDTTQDNPKCPSN